MRRYAWFLSATASTIVIAGGGETTSPPIGKTFWVDDSLPLYASLDERSPVITLLAGHSFTVEGTQSGTIFTERAYRVHLDDGRIAFILIPEFRWKLFDMHHFWSEGEQYLTGGAHLYTGDPGPIIQAARSEKESGLAGDRAKAKLAQAQEEAARIAAAKASIAAVKEWESRPNPQLGMTSEQATKSKWGRPREINRTITMLGTKEQWVYGSNRFLYFDNGILTGIQESE
jgi:hypothetical protein